MIRKIISGGQLGADMAGLDAGIELGIELGIEVGGTASHGYIQSTGPKSKDRVVNIELQSKYGLKEGQITKKQGQYGPYDDIYIQRTIANAQEADGSIWFGNRNSPGGKLTLGHIAQKGKPTPLINPLPEQIMPWMTLNNIEVVNIAGNREFSNPGIYQSTKEILIEGLKESINKQ